MRKKLLLSLCSMLFTIIVIAQTTATGKVVDEKGAAVSGASVQEKGTKNGTTTGSDGGYSLKVRNGAKLAISSIGFETMTVDAGTGVNTKMIADSKGLTEVVVTGFGTATSKKKTSIEVASISTKDAAKSVVGSVEQALMGKVAGAQIQFTSGTPGSSANIILRGINSLGGTKPLIMVDGIEISDLNGIDLGNVEKVEVVKGAAGGMLYGAQGGNGVIQIFTKKGSYNKKPEITLLTQVGSGTILKGGNGIFAKNHSMQTDAQGFITGGGTKILRDANGSWDAPDFMEFTGANANNVQNKPYKEQLFDHISQAYTKSYTVNTTLGISGGGEKSDYAFNISRYNEQNVMSNRYYRTSIGTNVGFELIKGLTFRNSLQIVFTNDDLLSGDADATIGGTGTGRFGLFNSFPYIDFTHKNAQGYTVVSANGGDKTTKNVLSEPEWRSRITTRSRIIENANLNYKINKFVELDYKYGIELLNLDRTNSYKNQNNAPQEATTYWGQTKSGSIYNEMLKATNQNSLATMFIKTDFQNDFKINFPLKTITQVAYDYRRQEKREYFAQGNGLPAYPPYNINVATSKTAGDFYETFVTYGVLFNQTFDYKDLAGVSLGLRSDYSSVFGGASEPATFSRISGYFRPTELFKIPYVSEWKLRFASAGAGIQPRPYENLSEIQPFQMGTGSTLISPFRLKNPLLKVEEAYETEIGTDITFNTKSKKWFSSISLGLSYWTRNSKNVIQEASLPLSSGASSIVDNLTDLKATGIDISLDAQILQSKNFTWDMSTRLGTTKSTVTRIANQADIVDGLFTLQEGKEVGLLNYVAPLTSITQINSSTKLPYLSATQQANAQIVNGMVVDTITKNVYRSAQTDPTNMGSFYPKFTASFTNTFSFKKMFTLSLQWDMMSGNKIYNLSRQWLYRDRLSIDNDAAVNINGKSGAYIAYYNSLYNSVSPITWFVEDGSFLRLRDISLTYNIPSSVKFLKNASFTISARNLITITDYSGLDPEATTTADAQGNEASANRTGAFKGVDYFGVPNLKSMQATLRLGF